MLDFALHWCQVEFGAYAQTRNLLTENNMRTDTAWAIVMGPSHNYQRVVVFNSLFTDKTLYRNKNGVTIVTMPEDAILVQSRFDL